VYPANYLLARAEDRHYAEFHRPVQLLKISAVFCQCQAKPEDYAAGKISGGFGCFFPCVAGAAQEVVGGRVSFREGLAAVVGAIVACSRCVDQYLTSRVVLP